MAVWKRGTKVVGRSCGGLNAKLHTIVDGLGNPVEFLLSLGNEHDSVHTITLLSKVSLKGSNVLGDKAYGAEEIRSHITEHGAICTISSPIQCVKPVGLRLVAIQRTPFSGMFFSKAEMVSQSRHQIWQEGWFLSCLCSPCFYLYFSEIAQLSRFYKQGLMFDFKRRGGTAFSLKNFFDKLLIKQ